ncbi:MAG: hypothetical protein V4506_00760 [Bacteroidota bacterium]
MYSYLKIAGTCLILSLSACSKFYTRHYTRGIYYDLSHHHAKVLSSQNTALSSAIFDSPDTLTKKIAPTTLISKKTVSQYDKPFQRSQRIKSETPITSIKEVFVNKHPLSRPLPHPKKSAKNGSSDSVIGTALLYILALILAVCIIALAIYFFPAVVIPAGITSTFMTLVVIAAVVIILLFIYFIYTLIQLLKELFKPKKVVEDDF